jgi:hypothetical protein
MRVEGVGCRERTMPSLVNGRASPTAALAPHASGIGSKGIGRRSSQL